MLAGLDSWPLDHGSVEKKKVPPDNCSQQGLGIILKEP